VAQIGLVVVALSGLGWNIYWSLRQLPHAPQPSVAMFVQVPQITWDPGHAVGVQTGSANWRLQVTAENTGNTTAIGCSVITQDVDQNLMPLAFQPVIDDVPWTAPVGAAHTSTDYIAMDTPNFSSYSPLEEVWIECDRPHFDSQSIFLSVDWSTKTASVAPRYRPYAVADRPWPRLFHAPAGQPCPELRLRKMSQCAMKPISPSASTGYP